MPVYVSMLLGNPSVFTQLLFSVWPFKGVKEINVYKSHICSTGRAERARDFYECPADKQLPSVYITIISCLHLHGCCNEKAGLTCVNMITELWNARFKPRGKSVMYLFVLVTEALLHNGRQPGSTAGSSGVLGCHRYGNMFFDWCVVSLRWLSCLPGNFKWGKDVWLSRMWHIHR